MSAVPSSSAKGCTVEELRRRIGAIPEMCAEVITSTPPWGVDRLVGRPIVVTGAGLAEGPARLLVTLWREWLDLNARFVPLSAFAVRAPRAEVLVVVSQGLSPNARLAMGCVERFESASVLTSAPHGNAPSPDQAAALAAWRRGGGEVWSLPPNAEEGMLLRVQGPMMMMVAAVHWSHKMGADFGEGLQRIGECLERAHERAPRGRAAALRAQHVILLGCGCHDEVVHGLGWKLMEGLWRPAPQVFDVLQLVHGPLQAFWGEEATVVALTHRRVPKHHAIWRRMQDVLRPHHEVAWLESEASMPLALLEHEMMLNALICEALKDEPRDLSAWPGKGHDGPLYDLCDPSELDV